MTHLLLEQEVLLLEGHIPQFPVMYGLSFLIHPELQA
jgi:hypothetical protein